MRRWYHLVIPLVIGLAAGIFYGWIIHPAESGGSAADTLQSAYKADYVLMVAEAYQADHDAALAAGRLTFLGSEPPAVIISNAIDTARQNQYATADLALMAQLQLDLQNWPAGGDAP
jgi:hypothetical protein